MLKNSNVVHCVRVLLTGTIVAPFWAHLSVVWDWCGHYTLTLCIIRGNGAPPLLLCNGPMSWQCSQGYLVRTIVIM